MRGLSTDALRIYDQNAERLATRFDAEDSACIFAPLHDLLPPAVATVVDVGAGTGRDAAWFADRGHTVTAVEPTDGLRRVGEARQGPGLEWLNDTLPSLHRLGKRHFDLVLVNGVWHHLDETERTIAIGRLADLTAPGGRLLVSLRMGPALPGQPVEPMEPATETARATAAGLLLIALRETESVQHENHAAGVTRTWLVLDRPGGQQP